MGSLAFSLKPYTLLETTSEHIRRAKEVQRLLAATHQRGRKVPDLLIAATAEAAKLTILHYDADFDLIASVTPVLSVDYSRRLRQLNP